MSVIAPEEPQLQLQQVSLTTDRGWDSILQDISFRVERGDRIGIVGPSGAGKTSLLRLLNRLQDPTSGQIRYAGQPLQNIPVLQLRREIMLVPQEPKLLGMTGEAAMLYPLKLRQVPVATSQQRLQFWTSQLEIPQDWLSRTELELSVGQRQLIALARGLICEPQVLLLDEPTSALDLGRVELLLQVLAVRSQTTLVSSHQLDFVARFCQTSTSQGQPGRLLWLDQGQVAQLADADQVDWQHLRQTIQQREQANLAEWG